MDSLLHLKTIAAVTVLTLKVLITRAPVKECSAFRIKTVHNKMLPISTLAANREELCH